MSEQIGRNESCPCGSGKKYKRCCGKDAAPILNAPAKLNQMDPGFDPGQMDPQMMKQLSEAFNRLPKGQMQKLQSLMQKAMSGKDVAAEAEALEKSLPQEFQSLVQSFQPPQTGTETASDGAGGTQNRADESSRKTGFWNKLLKK